MKLHTASEVISFAKELENKSAKFYQDSSQKYAEDEDVLLSFARENNKYVLQIERAYYGVITDAIESGFAFDLESDDYTLETELDNASYSEALSKAIKMEAKIRKFYSDAAEQSKSLLADVPANFVTIAKKRINRGLKLESLAAERG